MGRGTARILVAEDDPAFAPRIREALSKAGIAELLHVNRADRVLEAAADYSPDLVLLDLELPGGALELIGTLREGLDADEYLPILVATSDVGVRARRAAIAAGASDLLPKTLESWEIELRMRNLLAARNWNRKLREERERLKAVLDLQREISLSPPESLYEHLLRAAVRTVRGAEGGSVVVRDREGVFRFRAATGFDLAELREVGFSEADMRTWHGGGPDDWRRAEPRILSRAGGSPEEVGRASEREESLDHAGRLGDIQANLYLPVVYRGEVLAVLNLDNFHDPAAFDDESLAAARMFGPAVAALLHEARNRRLLAEAANTDPLTGLGNRRAFDRAFKNELTRGLRYGQVFSLMLMDLRRFKQINDELGHDRADAMLVELAAELRKSKRGGDRLFRWGGDEFTAVLPHTFRAAGEQIARRLARVAAGVCRADHRLELDIGVATFPEDGKDAESLLKAADRRMYAAKAGERDRGSSGSA